MFITSKCFTVGVVTRKTYHTIEHTELPDGSTTIHDFEWVQHPDDIIKDAVVEINVWRIDPDHSVHFIKKIDPYTFLEEMKNSLPAPLGDYLGSASK